MNISISELILVLLIALLVIKPEQLPDAARSIARFIKSIRHMSAKLKNEMNGFIDSKEQSNDEQRHEPK